LRYGDTDEPGGIDVKIGYLSNAKDRSWEWIDRYNVILNSSALAKIIERGEFEARYSLESKIIIHKK
jgi:hypothetical protein